MRDFSLMGIDIGTSTIKVLLWRQDGGFRTVRRPAKDSYVEVFGTGISEQDPTKLWQIVTECIKEALMGLMPEPSGVWVCQGTVRPLQQCPLAEIRHPT